MNEYEEYEVKPIKRNHITIEQLRTYEGFENVNDDEAEEILKSIRELCLVLSYIIRNRKKPKENNVIIFKPNRNKKAA